MMQDAKLAVTTFFTQIIFTLFIFIKSCTPFNYFFYPIDTFTNNYFYYFRVAKPIACNQGILDMFLKTIFIIIHYPCNSSLGILRVSFITFSFRDDRNYFVGEFL